MSKIGAQLSIFAAVIVFLSIAGWRTTVFTPSLSHRNVEPLPLKGAGGSTNFPSNPDSRTVRLEKSRNETAALTTGTERDASDIETQLRRFEPLHPRMSASQCLHLLLTRGIDAEFEGEPLHSGFDVLELFTNDEVGREYFGHYPIVRTRHGIRPCIAIRGNTVAARESHTDQTLACLAELDIALSHPFTVQKQQFTLRDMLLDSMASLTLKQEEIEWTTIAYVAYLPPQREWSNKFGNTITFDDLAGEVLSRPMKEASCSGCHLLEALIACLRVNDEITPILSPATRDHVHARLQKILSLAIERQRSDGSWDSDWYDEDLSASPSSTETSSSKSEMSRLLPTSHIPHWLMSLPSDLEVPAGVVDRAVQWLENQLRQATADQLKENFCPYSHAMRLLRQTSKHSTASSGRCENEHP